MFSKVLSSVDLRAQFKSNLFLNIQIIKKQHLVKAFVSRSFFKLRIVLTVYTFNVQCKYSLPTLFIQAAKQHGKQNLQALYTVYECTCHTFIRVTYVLLILKLKVKFVAYKEIRHSSPWNKTVSNGVFFSVFTTTIFATY